MVRAVTASTSQVSKEVIAGAFVATLARHHGIFGSDMSDSVNESSDSSNSSEQEISFRDLLSGVRATASQKTTVVDRDVSTAHSDAAPSSAGEINGTINIKISRDVNMNAAEMKSTQSVFWNSQPQSLQFQPTQEVPQGTVSHLQVQQPQNSQLPVAQPQNLVHQLVLMRPVVQEKLHQPVITEQPIMKPQVHQQIAKPILSQEQARAIVNEHSAAQMGRAFGQQTSVPTIRPMNSVSQVMQPQVVGIPVFLVRNPFAETTQTTVPGVQQSSVEPQKRIRVHIDGDLTLAQ
eukprot:Blabericola_migrator_1__10686@NODE_60_length_15787_cov_35_100891_g54_i0_p4_GENE_NODE_60_length_15787_cov_35_100891_g54_i0NODE_60_length_15787_cov_35_100891_g54_i0_p4_ORF_typecomplete_len291_score47_77_NODE_60_length_15787_cov_35_100891_g54_i09941866